MEEYPDCKKCWDIYGGNEDDIHCPKILKCGDTICRDCLEKAFKESNDEKYFIFPYVIKT